MRTAAAQLPATRRLAGKGAAGRARRAGQVPAVIYGQGGPGLAVAVAEEALRHLLDRGAGKILAVVVAGEEQPRPVVLKELQRDPLNARLIHADFQQVDPEHDVRLLVPIRVRGEDVLVRLGHILEHQVPQVELEGRPGALPEAIVIDVTQLAPGEHIDIGGLPVPPGVKVHGDPRAVVVTCAGPTRRMPELTLPAPVAPELHGTEGAPG